MRDADAQPFPVTLVRHRSSRGRELVASRAIRDGEVVLRCLPLALAPADGTLGTHCAACLSAVAPGAATACPGGCKLRWCAACARDARCAATHAAGECVSLRHLWALLGRGQSSNSPAEGADSAALRVLLRLTYIRMLERTADAPPAATECPHGDALRDDAAAADELVSHFDALTDEQRTHALAMADTARWCLVANARRAREALARDAAALWCNSFDVVAAETGTSLGEGVWPSAALGLNHSCEPNADFHFEPHNAGALCVRALRNVAQGEVLSISYCNVFSAERRRHLRGTYFFTCRCSRCARRDAAPHVPPLAAAAAAAVAAADAGGGTWEAVAEAATALESAVAPIVDGGGHWARLTLARARWLRMRAAAHGAAASAAPLPSAAALADELALLLGAAHPLVLRVRDA